MQLQIVDLMVDVNLQNCVVADELAQVFSERCLQTIETQVISAALTASVFRAVCPPHNGNY